MDTSNIVRNIAFGNYEAAKEAINNILLTKTAMALDEKKKEVAKKMYCEECNEQAEIKDEEITENNELTPNIRKISDKKKNKIPSVHNIRGRNKDLKTNQYVHIALPPGTSLEDLFDDDEDGSPRYIDLDAEDEEGDEE